MMQILSLLGKPDELDKSFISDSAAKDFIEQLGQGFSLKTLLNHFEGVNPELLAILANLLELNPYFRKPVSELLKSPVFDSIRV